MSKTHSDEPMLFDNLNVSQNSTQLKKLRFHPYYYQGRKGSLYLDDKRSNIKIVKIDKNDEELVLTVTSKKSAKKIELRSFWDQIEFDYYSICNLKDWRILFSKK